MGVLVLLGPPGSGKGTAAGGLATRPGHVHLSTGEVLRQAMRDDTEIGRAIRPFMDAGRLVPDELVLQIVQEQIELGGVDKTYILDGMPRNLRQAEMLDEYLQTQDLKVDYVLLLEAERNVLVDRLLGRLICLDCRSIFHLSSCPPVKAGICDTCGEPLHQRDDDVKETIEERLEVYRQETEPLVAYYQERGVLVPVVVAAEGKVGDTVEQISGAVGTE